MDTFVAYFLKTAVTLTVFYLFYRFFLRKETFFRFNRYYFLGSIVVSLLIPLIDVAALLPAKESLPVLAIPKGYISFQEAVVTPIATAAPVSGQRDPWVWVRVIYLAGVAFFLLRLLWQVVTLAVRIRRAEVREIDGLKIVPDAKVKSPFSFFSWIFVHPDQLADGDLEEVILHEQEHIRQHHSWDLLLVELLTVFQWPNPFVWLINRSVKEIHEYLADRAVLDQGVPLDKYQRTLISFVLGAGNPALITPLNFSLNQKRILMMKKMKSSNGKKWWSLLLLPVILMLAMAFSGPGENDGARIEKQKDQTYKLSGQVLDDATGKPLQGASVVIVNTSVGAMTDPEGLFTLTMDKPEEEIAFSFVGYQTVRQKVKAGDPVTVKLKKGVIRLDLKNVKAGRENTPQPPAPTTKNKTGEIFFVVEDVPHFPGELPALKKYLAGHVKYPPKARKKGISGTVWVNFTVDENGQVKQVYVDKANSVDPLLDKEAVRVISSLPEWTPGKQRGKAVPVELSVPVEFK